MGRSAWGNGTLTMSQASKLAIGAPVVFRRPFVERCERVVDFGWRRLGQYDAIALDDISDLIAGLDAEGRANRLRNRRLRLAGDFAGDHDEHVRNILTSVKSIEAAD